MTAVRPLVLCVVMMVGCGRTPDPAPPLTPMETILMERLRTNAPASDSMRMSTYEHCAWDSLKRRGLVSIVGTIGTPSFRPRRAKGPPSGPAPAPAALSDDPAELDELIRLMNAGTIRGQDSQYLATFVLRGHVRRSTLPGGTNIHSITPEGVVALDNLLACP